ncbi:MAG: hypothetical protein ACK4JD_05410 [Thermoflexales bacterium]
MTNIPLVLFLGVVSTLQTHLAKALERQGIEVFDQLQARLRGQQAPSDQRLRKPLIYFVGVVLNNTLFIWPILAQPYGPPALFSSVFGLGLVFLMLYAYWVLKEPISRREAIGAAAIVLGTSGIGYDNLLRAAALDRFTMNLSALFFALGVWLFVGLIGMIMAWRAGDLRFLAIVFGLVAGSLGSLDAFLKGIGQNYGGASSVLPATALGGMIFATSFVVGFLAFVLTQVAFVRKARASLLVPSYNAAFIGLPVFWQLILLPDYRLSWLTLVSLGLILYGVAAIGAFGRRPRRFAPSEPTQADIAYASGPSRKEL